MGLLAGRFRLLLLAVWTLALMLAGGAGAQDQVVVYTATYVSPSGEYRLTVDPKTRYGQGAAIYELRRGETVVWSGERPYTLKLAAVADDGTVGGYAKPLFHFRIVLLAPDGAHRVDRSEQWQSGGGHHGPVYPYGLGLILDRQNDRFIVRLIEKVNGSNVQSLRAFRLSTGQPLEPPGAGQGFVQSETAQVVDDTPGSRRPPQQKAKPVPELSLPPRELRHLGSLPLRSPGTTGREAVRSVRCFTLDPSGRMAFIRDERPPALVVVDQDGRSREVSLESTAITEASDWSGCAWTGSDRLVIAHSFRDRSGSTSAWWVDLAKGEVTAITSVDCPPIQRIEGRPDGSFVVLCQSPPGSGEEKSIHAYDARGRKQWKIAGTEARWTQDFTVTTSGEVAVLQNLLPSVVFYDADGNRLRTVELTAGTDGLPLRSTEVFADRKGGLVLLDPQGLPSITRVRADGSVLSSATAQRSDGVRFRVSGGVRAAPDGRLWVSNGSSLLRLDPAGKVDRTLGVEFLPGVLSEVSSIKVLPGGVVYVFDRTTRAVHQLSRTGEWLRVYVLPSEEIVQYPFTPHVAVRRDGDVFFGNGSFWPERYLHFRPDGTQARPSPLEDPAGYWYFQPESERLWVTTANRVKLTDPAQEKPTWTERRPDRTWIGWIVDSSVAPDGALAVLDWGSSPVVTSTGHVNIYSTAGEPERTVALPPDQEKALGIAFDGKRVVLSDEDEVFCLDRSGAPRWRFRPAVSPQARSYWRPFLVGDELWLYGGGRTIERYQLPE